MAVRIDPNDCAWFAVSPTAMTVGIRMTNSPPDPNMLDRCASRLSESAAAGSMATRRVRLEEVQARPSKAATRVRERMGTRLCCLTLL